MYRSFIFFIFCEKKERVLYCGVRKGNAEIWYCVRNKTTKLQIGYRNTCHEKIENRKNKEKSKKKDYKKQPK